MCKVIEVKKELEGLIYDINRGAEFGQDPEQVLSLTVTKISNVLKMGRAGYFKMVWER